MIQIRKGGDAYVLPTAQEVDSRITERLSGDGDQTARDMAEAAQNTADQAVPRTDIIDDLLHTDADKPLSAGQGKVEAAARAAADSALGVRIDNLETLGHYVGAFDHYAVKINTTVPANTSAFPGGIAVDDFVKVRKDETQGGIPTEYKVETIDPDTGDIAWALLTEDPVGEEKGEYDNYQTQQDTTVPTNKSAFPNGVTINDFVTVRADETQGNAITRYVAEGIDADTGDITWGFDFAVTGAGGEVDITGKADKVANAAAGRLAALDANGNLADSGKSVSDLTDISLANNAGSIVLPTRPTATIQSKIQSLRDNARALIGKPPAIGFRTYNLWKTIDLGATNVGDGTMVIVSCNQGTSGYIAFLRDVSADIAIISKWGSYYKVWQPEYAIRVSDTSYAFKTDLSGFVLCFGCHPDGGQTLMTAVSSSNNVPAGTNCTVAEIMLGEDEVRTLVNTLLASAVPSYISSHNSAEGAHSFSLPGHSPDSPPSWDTNRSMRDWIKELAGYEYFLQNRVTKKYNFNGSAAYINFSAQPDTVIEGWFNSYADGENKYFKICIRNNYVCDLVKGGSSFPYGLPRMFKGAFTIPTGDNACFFIVPSSLTLTPSNTPAATPVVTLIPLETAISYMPRPPTTPEGNYVGGSDGTWKQGVALIQQSAALTPQSAAIGTFQAQSVVRKSGSTVSFCIISNGDNAAVIPGGTTICTIPEGYRPAGQIIYTGSFWNTASTPFNYYINTNGTIVLGNTPIPGGTLFLMDASYITNDATYINAVGASNGTITPASGVSLSNVLCRKSGNTITVKAIVNVATATAAAATIMTLPAGFRPGEDSPFQCANWQFGGTNIKGWVHANGTVTSDEALPAQTYVFQWEYNTNEVTQVDSLSPYGTFTPTLNSNCAWEGGWQCFCTDVKGSRICTINGLLKANAVIPVNQVLLNTPNGFHPNQSYNLTAHLWTAGTRIRLRFQTNGNLFSDADPIPAGDYLALNITFAL